LAHEIPARLSRRDGRRFGLQVGTAFGVLAGVAHWRGRALTGWVLTAVAGFLLAGGLAAPAALVPVFRAWMRMAHAISKVTTPIVLGIVYFVVLTPIGLALRAAGNRSLSNDGGTTAWVPRPHQASDLKRQF
jgi:hypothetical protein